MNIVKQTDNFIEDQFLRNEYIVKTEVLDKVKALSLLPDGENMTIRQAADYFEVSIETIRKTIQRNRHELTGDGIKTLYSKDLKEYKLTLGHNVPELDRVPTAMILNRKCLLRIGMLLRDSIVAQTVREYLLRVEYTLSDNQKKAVLGSWTDEELLLIEQTIVDEKSKGSTKANAIRIASEMLNRNANNVSQKYYQITKKHGSMHNYLVEKNVIYLDSTKNVNTPTESPATPVMHLDIVQAITDQLESSLKDIKGSATLVSQVNELKLEIANLKNQLKMKDVLIEGKDAQLSHKSKLNIKLKKEKSDLEHKLKFISQIINSSKVIDNAQTEVQDSKKYVLKNGVIETK
ncbi:hypothetical protein [Paenibacillus sp. QZ-Y1]|uniref:hypothetical protein n=1 Tax=Paenibacillus sp. QZ-Y1 TaxID=3414511 RepID=UPI003F7AA419